MQSYRGVFQRPGAGSEQGVSRHKGNAGSPEGSRERLLVATSNRRSFAKKILDHFDMAEYF